MYFSAAQEEQPRPYATFELRSNLDSAVLARAVQAEIRGFDGTIPITQIKTLARQVDDSLAQERPAGGNIRLLQSDRRFAGNSWPLRLDGIHRHLPNKRDRNSDRARSAVVQHRFGSSCAKPSCLCPPVSWFGVPLAILASRSVAPMLFRSAIDRPAVVAGAACSLLLIGRSGSLRSCSACRTNRSIDGA